MNKKAVLFLLFFLCLIMLNSCAYVKPANKILPRSSFLHLRKTLTVYKCDEDTCSSTNYNSAASAFIIKVTNKGSYAITAAHVCEDEFSFLPKTVKTSSSYIVQRLDGESFKATSLTYKIDIDVCMLFVNDLIKDIKPVRIARLKPEPGERVYNLAAPRSIYMPNMVPIIEGRYNGDADDGDGNIVAWYTLPAAPGSSGSMIVNKNGELVGMVHSVFIQFPIMTLSTRYEDLKDFIFANLHKFEIYRNNMKTLGLEDIFNPPESRSSPD